MSKTWKVSEYCKAQQNGRPKVHDNKRNDGKKERFESVINIKAEKIVVQNNKL